VKAGKVQAYFKNHYNDDDTTVLNYMKLGTAFVWGTTPEGYAFWRDVYDNGSELNEVDIEVIKKGKKGVFQMITNLFQPKQQKHSTLYTVLVDNELLDIYFDNMIRYPCFSDPAFRWYELGAAFAWADTPEGASFWRRIYGCVNEPIPSFNDHDIKVLNENYAEYMV